MVFHGYGGREGVIRVLFSQHERLESCVIICIMKLHVHVLEARGLAARDHNGLSNPFVRLQLGSTKTKSAMILRTLNPSWREEFFFNVVGSDEELLLTIWDADRFSNDFLGQVKIPVSDILTAEKQTITRKWYSLQKRSERSKFPISGAFPFLCVL